MSPFLDDIRDGFESVVDKTEEYGKIGKIKVDIAGLNRQLDKLFTDLGKSTFEARSKNRDVNSDEQIQTVIDKIKSCQTDIANKQAEIEEIKHQKEQERKKRAEERKKEKTYKEKASKSKKTKDQNKSSESDVEDADIVDEQTKDT